jgi:polyhydroxyalkanoate synthesis repressor PhaR
VVTRTRASAPRTIRRYGNRKLYDPVDRRYVTLAELARLVARGHDVRVLDQATGADLTNLTLAQALLDSVRDGASRIPREALRQLIRFAAGPGPRRADWPQPEDWAHRARQEAERLVARLLAAGRLSLDDAVALRHALSEIVERLVGEAGTGVEARLRSLFAKGGAAAGRSLGALRGRIESYVETPARKTKVPARRRTRRSRK